ncbi:MAG: TonB-dependent receptor [Rhodospirillales bacterium]|nr:TonB-dependent receptor [Rhodospirillales bacterium]
MKNAYTRLYVAALLAGTCFAVPSFAHAQSASQEADSGAIDDIVVTATRREERLQDVPVAVTALGAEQLEDLQINEASALMRVTPNMIVNDYGGRPSSSRIGMRGPFNTDAIVTVDNPVGLYLNGVYIARTAGGNLNFFDVQRVEALRGPQGTLFGRNTIGGAVNVVPVAPTDEFEGSLELGYGNYDAFEGGLVVNVPITDQAAFRLSYQHREHGGYRDSNAPGGAGQELDDLNQDYVRAQFRLDASPNWDILLSADYTNDENNGTALTVVEALGLGNFYVDTITGSTDSLTNWVDPYAEHTGAQAQYFNGHAWGVSGIITGDLGPATLRSITAFREYDESNASDAEGTPYSFVYTIPGSGRDGQQFSQELQLFGTALDGRFDWITGVYYFNEEGNELTPYNSFPEFSGVTFVTLGSGENTSMAVFAQGTYNLTPDWRVTAGVRWARDERSVISQNYNGALTNSTPVTPVACALLTASLPDCVTAPPESDFEYFPFTIGTDYRFDENFMVYAKYSRGFRSGGWNLRATAAGALNAFEPEQLDSIEIGQKADFFDRHLRVNLAAYYDEYTDIQIQSVVVVGPQITSTITNSGDARIYGIEAEVTAVFGDWTLGATLGTADAEFTRVSAAFVDGDPFPYTPEYTGSVFADYSIPTSFGEINLHGDYTFRGETSWGTSHAAYLQATTLTADAYGTFNAVASIRFGEDVELQFWGKNLTDEDYLPDISDLSGAGLIAGNPGDPMTYGARLRYTY